MDGIGWVASRPRCPAWILPACWCSTTPSGPNMPPHWFACARRDFAPWNSGGWLPAGCGRNVPPSSTGTETSSGFESGLRSVRPIARRRLLGEGGRARDSAFSGVGQERRVVQAAIAVAHVEPLRAMDHAVGWIPLPEVECPRLVEILQPFHLESGVDQQLAKSLVVVEHLVIVGSRSNAANPGQFDVGWVGMESVGHSDPQAPAGLQITVAELGCGEPFRGCEVFPNVLRQNHGDRVWAEVPLPVGFAKQVQAFDVGRGPARLDDAAAADHDAEWGARAHRAMQAPGAPLRIVVGSCGI